MPGDVFDTRALVGDESKPHRPVGARRVRVQPGKPHLRHRLRRGSFHSAPCLRCLVRGAWPLHSVTAVALLAALSRPLGVPLGAFVGLWWFWCTVSDYLARRSDEPSRLYYRMRGLRSAGASRSSWAHCSSAVSPSYTPARGSAQRTYGCVPRHRTRLELPQVEDVPSTSPSGSTSSASTTLAPYPPSS